MYKQTPYLHSLIENLLYVLQNTSETDADAGADGKTLAAGSHLLADGQKIETAREFAKFMDEMPGGFFIYRAHGAEELLYANAALLRIFNCSSMEQFRKHTGNSFKGIVHPDDLEAVEKSIYEQIQHNQDDLDYVEYRIIRTDGQIRWLEDYGHFVRSETLGDIFYVFVGDATEKRNRLLAERAIFTTDKLQKVQNLQTQIDIYNRQMRDFNREHLQRLEVIEGLSANYESILYADLDINKVIPYRLSSRTEYQFNKKYEVRDYQWYTANYVKTWVCPEDRELVLKAADPVYIRKRLSSIQTYYINFRVLMDGEVQYLQLRIVDVRRHDHVAQIVMGYRRVDEEIRREMEQKKIYQDALEHAKQANDAKNLFLSNMSHDLRTPLNAITGFTALARNPKDREQLLHCLDQIEASSAQLLDLINNVLEFSQMESGMVHLEETPFNIYDLLQEIYTEMQPSAQAKNLSFTLHTAGVRHSSVCSDRRKIHQILMTLIGNAVKYTEPGGNVSITVTEQASAAVDHVSYWFAVEDSGIGMPEDFVKRIYEPFGRQQNTTISGVLGTGLRLSIAKNLTDMLGGTIDIHSIPDQGSRFTLILDMRIEKNQMEPPAGLEEKVLGLVGSQKILLVEDNEVNTEIEMELLESLGFHMDTAENGSIAVEKVSTSRPGDYALVLMDIQMPVMDGHHAARTIRALDNPRLASLPIIALSANAFDEDRKMSMESGMNAHLAKPLDVSELLKLMWKILLKNEEEYH